MFFQQGTKNLGNFNFFFPCLDNEKLLLATYMITTKGKSCRRNPKQIIAASSPILSERNHFISAFWFGYFFTEGTCVTTNNHIFTNAWCRGFHLNLSPHPTWRRLKISLFQTLPETPRTNPFCKYRFPWTLIGRHFYQSIFLWQNVSDICHLVSAIFICLSFSIWRSKSHEFQHTYERVVICLRFLSD